MAKAIFQQFLFMVLVFFGATNPVNAQFNPATNSFIRHQHSAAGSGASWQRSAGDSSVSCGSNTFWTINEYRIMQFELSGNVVTDSEVIADAPGTSLAYCNNLNGGAYGPTFYTSPTLEYYDLGGWVVASNSSSDIIANSGGNGNYLYYLGGPENNQLFRYTGTTFNQVYDLSALQYVTVAGVAVDDSGNAWVFTGPEYSIATGIQVISPAGQIIQHYSVDSLNTNNAYGAFMLNNVLYVGIGVYNAIHPNVLVPFSFSNDSAMMGAFIPMPVDSGYDDMASCNPGAPLSQHALAVKEVSGMVHTLDIFPNPAGGPSVTIAVTASMPGGVVTVNDIAGRTISFSEVHNMKQTIPVSDLSNGVYLVTVVAPGGERATGKLVISK